MTVSVGQEFARGLAGGPSLGPHQDVVQMLGLWVSEALNASKMAYSRGSWQEAGGLSSLLSVPLHGAVEYPHNMAAGFPQVTFMTQSQKLQLLLLAHAIP